MKVESAPIALPRSAVVVVSCAVLDVGLRARLCSEAPGVIVVRTAQYDPRMKKAGSVRGQLWLSRAGDDGGPAANRLDEQTRRRPSGSVLSAGSLSKADSTRPASRQSHRRRRTASANHRPTVQSNKPAVRAEAPEISALGPQALSRGATAIPQFSE
jgi:hypothetical protein